MTRPNNFINRNAGFSYPLAYYPWSYLPSGPFNMGNNMPYSPFQNHLPFLNMQAYKSPYHNGTMPALPFQANDNSIRAHLSAINALADDRKKSRSNKFQKNEKVIPEEMVIQISDDEAPAQLQKGEEDRATNTSSKVNASNSPINAVVIEEPRVEQKNQQKSIQIQELILKEAKPIAQKIKKIHKICQTTKRREAPAPTISEPIKTQTFSQRIISKNSIKKQIYKLSKKQKELLEICFLRDVDKEILTGPKFQAELPKFDLSNTSLKSWKNELRTNLLQRRQNDEE